MVTEGYKNTEIGVIPEDWEIRRLADIGEIKMCKRIFQYQTEPVGKIPFYKIGTFGKEADAFISKELYLSYKQQYSYPKKGDILISAAGTIGRTLIFDGKPSYYQDSNIVWIDNDERLISNKLLYYIFQIVKYNTEGGTIQRLYNSILRNAAFPLPPKPEQIAIATALSDVDALISATEKLIAKKKAIKQGAMQELLKPREGWEEKTIEDCTECLDFLRIPINETQRREMKGDYPYCGANGILDYINDWIIEDEVILIAEDGGYFDEYKTRPIAYKMKGKFWVNNHAHILKSKIGYNQEFIFYSVVHKNILSYLSSGTRAKLNKSEMFKIDISFPKSISEQTHIATILSNMDAEISLLEQKLEKQKQIKQGMMQNLLTGKIRLVESVKKEALQKNIITLEKPKVNTKFQDAVLITAIVNAFYSEKYLLGRKKVQKLLYLVLRKQAASVALFKRKAAGPYAHTVRYNGGEGIAIKKHYINAQSNKSGTIFSIGDNIDEALSYIERWDIQPYIDWLESEFKHLNVNKLEVLATVDMAICDLEKENKIVSLKTIKKLMMADKVWKKKLEKPYFSDTEIQKAIDESKRLFGNK